MNISDQQAKRDAGIQVQDGIVGLVRKRFIDKPTLQLAGTSIMTGEYITNKLNIKCRYIIDKRKNRRKKFHLRVMPTNLIYLLPKIIPYLIFKKELAILALEICQLRQEIPNGQSDHPNVIIVKEKIELLKKLNKNKYL